MITLYSFRSVPSMVQGLVRDLRVRWALEEAGLAYQSKLITGAEKDTPQYRALQPFGQVPAYEEDGLTLFESGAIVLHIAQRSEALLPTEPTARARATTWIFAAINTVEPALEPLAIIDLFHAGEDWAKQRRPDAEKHAMQRLKQLSERLGDRDYLEGRFTAGDLMMTTVLRNLRHCDMVAREPRLAAYLARCEARPAFQRALAAHMNSFAPAPLEVA